jgi:hypothetical protein
MKKSIFILSLLIVSIFSFGQAVDPNTGEPQEDCQEMVHLSQFALPGIFDINFLHTEISEDGSIAYVYEYVCLGILGKRRCKRSGGVCGKGKLKMNDDQLLMSATVQFPDENGGFTAEESCTISDCGDSIIFE